jgi:hypothetical protein
MVVWALLGIGLLGGAILLHVVNCNFMPRVDAALTTAVQLSMVVVILAVGTAPPVLLNALKSIPAGISRQCPPEHHTVKSRHRIKVAALQSRFDPTEPVAAITSFGLQRVSRYSAMKLALNGPPAL